MSSIVYTTITTKDGSQKYVFSESQRNQYEKLKDVTRASTMLSAFSILGTLSMSGVCVGFMFFPPTCMYAMVALGGLWFCEFALLAYFEIKDAQTQYTISNLLKEASTY